METVRSGTRDEEDEQKWRMLSWRRNLLTCFALPSVEQVADCGPEPPGLLLTGKVEADLAGLMKGNRSRRRRQRVETPARAFLSTMTWMSSNTYVSGKRDEVGP